MPIDLPTWVLVIIGVVAIAGIGLLSEKRKQATTPELVRELRKQSALIDAMEKGIRGEIGRRPVSPETILGYWKQANAIWEEGRTTAQQQGLQDHPEVKTLLSHIRNQSGRIGNMGEEERFRRR